MKSFAKSHKHIVCVNRRNAIANRNCNCEQPHFRKLSVSKQLIVTFHFFQLTVNHILAKIWRQNRKRNFAGNMSTMKRKIFFAKTITWKVSSVIRLGEISPLWHTVKELWPFWKHSFSIWHYLELILANFKCN